MYSLIEFSRKTYFLRPSNLRQNLLGHVQDSDVMPADELSSIGIENMFTINLDEIMFFT